MKGRIRSMLLFTAFALISLLAMMAWIRLAPSDPQVWDRIPPTLQWDVPPGQVAALTGAAQLRIPAAPGSPDTALARLDRIALATPRTTRLTGTADQGRITWVTRSALWGFPDYTTAEQRDDGLYLYARLRFGAADFGVNAARLADWLGKL